MDLPSIENYENTILEKDDFRFNCFLIDNSNTPSHWHNHTEVMYIEKGSCSLYINGVRLLCGEGDIIFIPRGSLHSTIIASSCRYYAIVMGDSLFNGIMMDSHGARVLAPYFSREECGPFLIGKSDSSYPGLCETVLKVIAEDRMKRAGYELMVKSELCSFFIILFREYPRNVGPGSAVLDARTVKMKDALEYVFAHYKEKITLSRIAAISHMSDQHFCRLFKSYTGKTFVRFLTDYRLEQADRLLRTTDLPVTRIPELTGFCNGNYFSRVYREKYGRPPSAGRTSGQRIGSVHGK